MRTHNEDAFLSNPDKRLWAVADGMGGHSAGDVASQTTVRRLDAVERPAGTAEFVNLIDDALMAANDELIVYARENDLELVGSTAVVLFDAGDYMMCGWVGDSRCYKVSDGQISALTTDHSQGQEMIDSGAFTAEEVEQQHQAAALVRAIGAEKRLVAQWVVSPAQPGECFLLCSDGVTKEIEEDEIGQILSKADGAQDGASRLIQTCLDRGARDNITAVVVKVED